MIREVWAPLYSYGDEYLISTHGRVLSRPRVVMLSNGRPRTIPGRIIKLQQHSDGYMVFTACRDGIRKMVRVHQAVLKTFVGPAPEGHIACHWDDDKTNNHLDNLRWGTYSDNARDTLRNGNNYEANKTHCKNGHEYRGENLYRLGSERRCRTCAREAQRRLRAAKRERQQHNQEGVA
ncbi:MAG: NUMOD4 motif-containing HNH endonuclease [Mycobacterium sp.]|nr:NUMOD4 motif-containing HNH endonuclease [Mycobacterium sp.]